MSFQSLGLMPELVRAVADEGYVQPTPVQREAIPIVLAGRDLLAGAQTGTGKTAAFVLPLLQRLHGDDRRPSAPGDRRDGRPPRGAIRALILTPTRELALQVEASVRTYGRHRPVSSAVVYGGVGFGPQVRALRAGPAIVVATPGRLLDHMANGTIDLSRVEVLVLDEADRMLDMGFIRDIRRVLAALPSRRQNLLLSATFSDEIRALAEGLLDDPATVDVAPRNTPTELVDQVVIPVDRRRKEELLSHLIRSGRLRQALVFARTKHGADRLAARLGRDGIATAAIHGNKSQGNRTRTLADFKSGRVGILVATDIAARGIDIDALPHVVNFELPMVAGDYIHRIGRTGRAGVDGRAVSLVSVDEADLLRDIERLLRRRIPAEMVPGFEPDPTIRPEPIRLRSGGAGGRAGGPRAGSGRPSALPRPATASRPAAAPRPSIGARPPIGARPSSTARPARRWSPAGPPRPSSRTGQGSAAPHPRFVTLPGERLSGPAAQPRPARAGGSERRSEHGGGTR